MRKFAATDIEPAAAYFDRWGYAVFENAFDPEDDRRFWDAVEAAIQHNQQLTYSMYGQLYSGASVPLDGKKLPRIVDIESHAPETAPLMLAPLVTTFLKRLYKGLAPTCLQTLTYKYSSEQGAHADKLLVSPPQAPDYDRETLAAAWFALEASNAENGALIIYPGSHRVPKPDDSWNLQHNYRAYAEGLDALCRGAGCPPEMFQAAPGDILFWHADLVHAGGPITSDAPQPPTRKSLVCHYAALPIWRRSRDPQLLRVRYGDGTYFHKRAYLRPLRRSPINRFLGGPRIGRATER